MIVGSSAVVAGLALSGVGSVAQADAVCEDGSLSRSEGSGTCSWHDGVDQWIPDGGASARLDPTPPLTESQRDARRELRELVADPELLALTSECATRQALLPDDPDYMPGPTDACVERLRREQSAPVVESNPQPRQWASDGGAQPAVLAQDTPSDGATPTATVVGLLAALGLAGGLAIKKAGGERASVRRDRQRGSGMEDPGH